jgi:hypothetical protein
MSANNNERIVLNVSGIKVKKGFECNKYIVYKCIFVICYLFINFFFLKNK